MGRNPAVERAYERHRRSYSKDQLEPWRSVRKTVACHGLAEPIDTAIAEAVNGLRACGYSWAEITPGSAATARPPSSAGEPLAGGG